MWTILRYRYISCFKNIFSPFFYCKNKLSPLVSAVLIAVAIVFGTNIAFIFMKVDSHFYGIGYTSIFRVFKAFSLLIFYMGFYILIWGFSRSISGVFKKISVGALVYRPSDCQWSIHGGGGGYNSLPIEPQMTSYIIETVRTKCIIGEALKVRGQKYDKLSLKIV